MSFRTYFYATEFLFTCLIAYLLAHNVGVMTNPPSPNRLDFLNVNSDIGSYLHIRFPRFF